jgi:hypothetical protein
LFFSNPFPASGVPDRSIITLPPLFGGLSVREPEKICAKVKSKIYVVLRVAIKHDAIAF